MVDIGFGSGGPTQSLPLQAGKVFPRIPPQKMRLVRDNISEDMDAEQRLWIYQHRKSETEN